MWDFAAGCMRTYLILGGQGRALPRGRRDPGRAARRAKADRLAEPTGPLGSTRSGSPTLRRGRAGRPGLRPRAPRPARHRAAARRALDAPGRRRRLVDVGVQGRGARRRHRRARRVGPGAAPADARRPAASRTRGTWWAAFEAACAEAGVLGRHRPAAIAVAGQQHGLVVLDADGDGAAPGQAVERHRVGARRRRAGRRALGGPTAWADGVRQRARRQLHDHQAARGCAGASPTCSRRVAAVLLPHDWLTSRLTGAAHDRPRRRVGHRLLVARPRSATGTTCSPSSTTPSTGTRVLPEVLGPDRAGRRVARARSSGPGTGDNMAAALGLGLRPGDVALSLGTQRHRLRASATARRADPTGTVAGFADATGRFLPARLHAQRHQGDRRRRPAARRRRRRASTRSPSPRRPGAGGLVLVPHLDGERTPNRPDATGTLTGIRSDVTPRAARPGRGRGRGVQPARRRRRARPAAPRDGAGCCWSAAAPAAPPTARSSPT